MAGAEGAADVGLVHHDLDGETLEATLTWPLCPDLLSLLKNRSLTAARLVVW
jgi:hypothetical protein